MLFFNVFRKSVHGTRFVIGTEGAFGNNVVLHFVKVFQVLFQLVHRKTIVTFLTFVFFLVSVGILSAMCEFKVFR